MTTYKNKIFGRNEVNCKICGVSCCDNNAYTQHINGRRHKNTVAKYASSHNYNYYCELCSVGSNTKENHEAHLNGKRHRNRSVVKTFIGEEDTKFVNSVYKEIKQNDIGFLYNVIRALVAIGKGEIAMSKVYLYLTSKYTVHTKVIGECINKSFDVSVKNGMMIIMGEYTYIPNLDKIIDMELFYKVLE